MSTTYNTQSTEYYKTDISKYMQSSINISLMHLENLLLNPAYLAAFLVGLKISAAFNMDCKIQYHYSLFKEGCI